MTARTDFHLLALDQGTTSTRAILFGADGAEIATARRPLAQSYPRDGWVEHDPREIAAAALDVLDEILDGRDPSSVAAIGITNQRETTVVWDRATGQPIHPAIVWQDRRTADICARLKAEGVEPLVRAKTGLLLDPYFSGTKLAWILDQVPGARARAERGELAFGTVDAWLLWILTRGEVHATDATNASRTMLFDIRTGAWDEELTRILNIPKTVLPEVRDTVAPFGRVEAGGRARGLPIYALVGDQQSAALGQACLSPGQMKSTYGTGCFALVNTGDEIVESRNKLLGTVASRIGGRLSYALEGSIFMAGATIQWLRDRLGLFRDAAETEALARAADPASRAVVVPAFVGLGAPYWDPDARGAILGLTRADGRAEIVRAGLESVSLQTRDLLEAIAADYPRPVGALRVDGGMVANDWFCQNLADLTGAAVERPRIAETTALGAALAAGLGAGVFSGPEDVARFWKLDRRFEPAASADARDSAYARWREAVDRVRSRGD